MIRYTAKDLIDRAKALADLENSSFITWSDNYQMLNSVYRVVYQDMIQAGETSYLKEVRLLSYGTSKFALPDDFYQMAMLCDDYGNEIPLRRLDSSVADIGYEIKNNTITLHNVRNNCVLKYYPVPETITYKAPRTKDISFPSYPVSAWGTEVLLSDGRIFDVAKQAITVSTTRTFNNPILGKNAILDRQYDNGGWQLYWKDGTVVVDTMSSPQLRTDGEFYDVYIPYDGSSHYHPIFTWGNDDGSEWYGYCMTPSEYDSNHAIITSNGTYISANNTEGKVLYWDGKWCLLMNDKIYYPDGSYLTIDSKSKVPLKADFETGYGVLVQTGSSKYAIEGFAPNTIIDYPNNVLFDITAYRLAIQYRMKQNSDSSALQMQVMELTKSYYASLSNGKDYPVIRNVDGRYKYGWF